MTAPFSSISCFLFCDLHRINKSTGKLLGLIHIKYSLKRDNLCCLTSELSDQICVKINSNETYKKSQYHIESDLWNEEEDEWPGSTNRI